MFLIRPKLYLNSIADVGTKQGEKADYAIFKDDEVVMLIECKKYGEDLSDVHTSQLYRYFLSGSCAVRCVDGRRAVPVLHRFGRGEYNG